MSRSRCEDIGLNPLRVESRQLVLALWALVAIAPGIGIASEINEAIVSAARQGDEATVARLLKQGAKISAATPDGMTALHWAVHHVATDVVRLLVRSGANVDAANRYGVTSLMLAATNGSESALKLLLEADADPNLASPEGETPLMLAARTGKPDAVRGLLSSGAKVNVRENLRGQTALMWAAAEGHTSTVGVLLNSDADMKIRSKGGFTALLFAVRQGQIDVVRQLISAGGDANESLPQENNKRRWQTDQDSESTRDVSGPGALHLAIINAHYELAAYLLTQGADPDGAQPDRTPLHTITGVRRPGEGSNNPSPPGSGKLDSMELVRKLVSNGADVNARAGSNRLGVRTVLNLKGATPFLLAARTADAELMRLLAELGADPLIPNVDNTTPLMVAAGVGVQSPGEDPGNEREVYDAVKVALELGNDVNAVDDRGETAMHGAAYKYAASTVQLLINHGADIEVWNRKNKLGWTPLRIATGVHRAMNLRSSPETAAALRRVMTAAGVSTHIDPETNINGATK